MNAQANVLLSSQLTELGNHLLAKVTGGASN